ncbi:MAG: tyrosine-type recombinase/integrase, partial [Candidatus Atribacteria bacterium]|nr:tyrosine-type recombinase/integrase [Candidatus Atribacteria bacterium]
MIIYCGIYAPFIEQYISFKRSLGYKFVDAAYTYLQFDRFTIENKQTKIGITKDFSERWAEKRPNESDSTRYRRILYLAQFSAFLNEAGYPSFIPRLPKSYKSTFVPYIFSKDEMEVIILACDRLKSNRNSNTSVHVIPALFRTLYGTGIRISEALALKNSDVNLDEKYLIIRESKNGRERIIALSKSLAKVCLLYSKSRHGIQKPDGPFFVKRNGQKCSSRAVYEWLRKVLWVAGISHGGRGQGPRLHDFRHVFSVHSLAAMSEAGLDLYYSLPILST